MRVSTTKLTTSPHPDHRLPLAGSARAAAGLAPETGGRRDQDRSRRSGLPHAPYSPNAPKLGSGSVSRGLPLGEGPTSYAPRAWAPRPKGGRGRLTHYPKLHRIRQATRSFLTALLAWSGEKYGIDPVYLGVLLLASFQLGMQRLLGR
jgi:hypothetical protein